MKTGSDTALLVHHRLADLGIETPLTKYGRGWLDDERKRDIIAISFKTILQTMGLDLTDDSLEETPRRVAKLFLSELFYGLDYMNFPSITTVENKMGYDEMIVERGIAVKSMCEHHFLTINGVATVAYIPNKYVIGLSKLNRVVDFFAHRPQIQERMTEQVHATLKFLLDTDSVAVMIDADHNCVKHRGIEDTNSFTTTSKLSGEFKNDALTRSEFFSIARREVK